MRRSGGTTADAGDGRNVDNGCSHKRAKRRRSSNGYAQEVLAARRLPSLLATQIGRAAKRGKHKGSSRHPETVMKKGCKGN
jgi:hypothetical protein